MNNIIEMFKNHQRNRTGTENGTDLDITEHKNNSSFLHQGPIDCKDEEVPLVISYPGPGESDSLLTKNTSTATNPDQYGGVGNGSKSILKPSGNLSSSDRPPSPIASPALSRARRPARRKEGNDAALRASGNSVLSGYFNRSFAETTPVLAPDDSLLPSGTPLLGSSKLAANAIARSEMRHDDESATGAQRGGGMAARLPSSGTLGTLGSARTARTLQEIQDEFLQKVRSSFIEDAMNFSEGTIPQSIVVSIVIGCVCGVVAYAYYYVLDYFLELVWKELPLMLVMDAWPERLHVLWIPLVGFTLSICCGLSIYYLGEPGDLAYTIQCIHSKGYKGTHHIVPMVAASQFTILAGASLGPEAPLVAICAATAGYISRVVFRQTNRNVVRKHTFMGMAGALAAFFGVPLGGSLFALEVASRFGVEYFEHLVESIFAGEVCVVVFRSLAGLPLERIWKIAPTAIGETEPYMILLGAGIGLFGAGLAFLWANFHWRLMDLFRALGLLDDENAYAVPRILLGAVGVVTIGMLVPQTMFWGEWEVGVIATLSPASELPHVWPTTGLIGFEMDSFTNCLIVGFAKLIAISFTVAGGYRGGFIFPFFAAGAAFGRALCFVFPDLSPVIATLCCAAGINVAITRTALSTSLILSFLAGEQFALPAVLAASIVSLFATGYVPFIKSQLARSDIDFSLYYRQNRQPKVQDHA
eukprot:CAMPEP_0172540892 /NCGR_PEP_ID=MMETSP1067-20121228/11796_1 /TAXON_ID=265564 ORGANISM="Thalassiosira punctigera, Strain Tpunct2005C2" /NCGR_SAMPLE_ID=MMETSP1067 /ASSEMBLY_ACC=CAM_ASM_000444 /LENGTH=700 /DNA_ID=CAMNT_0013326817 /DNA_START=110 /DNA_END=2212 /DNA_ORIENTATION=-